MAKLTRLQIILLVAAGAILLLSVPATLVFWLATHKSDKPSYDQPPPTNWTKVFARSVDINNSRAIIAAQIEFGQAEKLCAQNKTAEAHAKFIDAISMYETALGADDTVTTLSILAAGRAEADAGDWKDAETLFQRVIDNNARGNFNSYTCSAMQWLASSREKSGDTDGAEAILTRCLHLQEKALSNESVELLPTLRSLARVTEFRDKKASEAIYERAYAIAGKNDDRNGRFVAGADLAWFYVGHKSSRKAKSIYSALLKLSEKPGVDPQWRVYFLERLFDENLYSNQFAQLRTLADEALSIRLKERNPDRICLFTDFINMSLVESLENQPDRARLNLNKALEQASLIGKKQYRRVNLSWDSCKYVRFKKWSLAEELLAVMIKADENDSQRRSMLCQSRLLMAQLLAYQGKYRQSAELLQKICGEEDISRRQKMSALADLYLLDLCCGNHEEAKPVLKRLQALLQPVKDPAKMGSAAAAPRENTAKQPDGAKPDRVDTRQNMVKVSSCYYACLTDGARPELKDVDLSEYGDSCYVKPTRLAELLDRSSKRRPN
jgi:hypothetical protein